MASWWELSIVYDITQNEKKISDNFRPFTIVAYDQKLSGILFFKFSVKAGYNTVCLSWEYDIEVETPIHSLVLLTVDLRSVK